MSLAIGPLTRLFTRKMYRFIDERRSCYEVKQINYLLKEELNFWERNLAALNGYKIKGNPLTSKIVYSDASDNGYGGYIVQRLSSVLAQGSFTPEENLTSSNYRELLAVKFVLQSVGVHLKNETVKWFSDNINVSGIIEVGSRRPHLHKLAIEIFDICMCFNIKLQPSWIPREQNETADFLLKN